MVLLVLAYLGGILTILSPCILPVLPFVFARANHPFTRSGLPMLVGMVITFGLVATLAAVAGAWAVEANRLGRAAALVLLTIFGLSLVLPTLAERLMSPLVALGGRLSQSAEGVKDAQYPTIASSLLLGIATGLLWAPCAGPILGLILTGAALNGANAQTSLFLLAYACGAATSLAAALLIGGQAFSFMKKSLASSEWIRRGLGVAVLVAVAAISLGLDTGILTRVSVARTAFLEQKLLDKFHPPGSGSLDVNSSAAMVDAVQNTARAGTEEGPSALPVEGTLPSLSGAAEWINANPLTPEDLKGKVVLVDFWTYSCINCLRTLPYIRSWAEKYKDQGLVVIGVHAPEFAFEKNLDNVRRAVSDLMIRYPVAVDNDYAIWRSFNNQYWPAHYFIDAQGRIRHHHFGEGNYEESEKVIQQLLAEAGRKDVPADIVEAKATGAEAQPDMVSIKSPETYIGYERAENFVSPGGTVQDRQHSYQPGMPNLNEWGLSGDWTIQKQFARLNEQGGSIIFKFHARDLHLVLGPDMNRKPIHFRITIDGQAPGDNHGSDVSPDGQGVVTEERLFQLVRQREPVMDHIFQIQFLDPGVEAYAFTFG